jgi:hypothetical protein
MNMFFSPPLKLYVMDKRETLVVHASFLELLENLKATQQKASLLVDDGGIGRQEGLVVAIIKDDNGTWVHLNNGQIIKLENIVAVNGLFLSDYSEC